MTDKKPSTALQPLGGTSTDPARAIFMGALSGIPVVGGVISEIVGQVIPDQRLERLEEYVRCLGNQLAGLEEDVFRDKMQDPENVDLFEDGAFASARATSHEKRERIARLVAFGLTGEEQERIEAKRLLGILGQLGDDQIIRLLSYLSRHHHDGEFRETHKSILEPGRAHLGADRSVLDQAVIKDLARAELIQMGLLREKFATAKKGEMPEFDDKTGRMKVKSRDLTPLARLLLRRIGLIEENEF